MTLWQTSLIEKLNKDAGEPKDDQLENTLQEILSKPTHSNVSGGLGRLQNKLYSVPESVESPGSSVQWLGVRDFLEEAEVAAGMIQRMLAEHSDLTPADIGLLIPDSFEYSVAVEDALSLAGLPVSGLPVERWRRDLGREALFHFLYCRQKPAPAMALAVCLSSPLMPWTQEEGAVLAQKVMDGNYQLKPFHSASDDARAMLELIRKGDEKPAVLIQDIKNFVSLLDGDDGFAAHIQQAKFTVDQLCISLKNTDEIDWITLRRESSPQTITTSESPHFNLEGVTIWREGHEPWRPVRKLLVLGFAAGNYPVVSTTSAVFSADDLDEIHEHLRLKIETPADELNFRRERFKRQLANVSDGVTFLIPRRNSSGASQSPSESLVFMHQLFFDPEESEDSEDMILNMDAVTERKHIRYLPLAETSEPESAREIVADDIKFDRNLLELRLDEDGKQKPQSPSSLETLMVSRLAWLLRQLHAEPLGWAPESPNIMLLGTLAHQVFEKLFQAGKSLPEKDDIISQVPLLLDEAILQHGPFLRAVQWQVERQHLATGTIKAALAWLDILQALDAEILGCEEWLQGNLNGVPIHGQADVLLGLPDDRLLVVDYKRSSSNSRKPRMQNGYDSQANLYLTMLKTDGPKNKENAELINLLKNLQQTGIVYFLLNDQSALSDSILAESGGIPGWDAIADDVAGNAIYLINKRLAEVKQGEVKLNREGDEVFFDKQAGVKPYALQNSPLISLFTIPGEAEEAQ